MLLSSREIHLVRRPQEWPVPEDFALVSANLAPPADGQVLVRNLFLSVDPYMRSRMNDVPSYLPPFQLNQPLDGSAVGHVVDSRAPGLTPGDVVVSNRGWWEAFDRASRSEPPDRRPEDARGAGASGLPERPGR